MLSVKDKLNYDYQRFYLDMMRTSKENIYAKAEEIMTKRLIFNILAKNAALVKADRNEIMFSVDNIVESAFRYFSDYGNDLEDAVNQSILEWMQTLSQN